MKIKSRLFLYNILIITISSILIIASFIYMNNKSSDILYDVDSITVDDNAIVVEALFSTNYSYQTIAINLAQYNYDLYVYSNDTLIYGIENPSLEKLLQKYPRRRNEIKTLFVDNKTTVMKIVGDTTYFAVHESTNKNITPFFNHFYNPMEQLLSLIILVIVIVLIIILFFAVFSSNSILKKVMHPLKLLQEGAERVEDGNYSSPIEYQIDDEFAPVIENFNKMQLSLKEKTEKQQTYERAKKEMINGISHDIRTPLTVVKGNIKGIKDGVAATKDKRNKYLDIAYNRVLDIEDLLNRLFATFNYETGEIKLNKEKTAINSYITEVINSNENVINKVLKIDTTFPNEEVYSSLDQKEFKRVFDNLINNAIKHNKDNENLKMEIKVAKEKNNLKIIIKDNGKGVSPKNITKIFDEFFKEDASRNTDKAGSGLGLFIVKKIVESHGGTITAKNDNGLSFEIILQGEK